MRDACCKGRRASQPHQNGSSQPEYEARYLAGLQRCNRVETDFHCWRGVLLVHIHGHLHGRLRPVEGSAAGLLVDSICFGDKSAVPYLWYVFLLVPCPPLAARVGSLEAKVKSLERERDKLAFNASRLTEELGLIRWVSIWARGWI
jgi:hypothetical protein